MRLKTTIWQDMKPANEDFTPYMDTSAQILFYPAKRNLPNRTFVRTNCGYIGTAPLGSQVRDLITVLFGCEQLMILRSTDTSGGLDPTYLVVGPSYVHGIMNGETFYRDAEPCRYKAVHV